MARTARTLMEDRTVRGVQDMGKAGLRVRYGVEATPPQRPMWKPISPGTLATAEASMEG